MVRLLARSLPVVTLLGALAAPASADPASVLASAQQLAADYDDLLGRIDACPGGDCASAERLDILSDAEDLDDRRLQLHQDRSALGSCSCGSLDALITSIDDMTDEVVERTIGWEET